MTEIKITKREAAACFDRLWHDAFKIRPFDVLCTLLRVSGLQAAGWDPLEESEEAFEDYNWYLKAESESLCEGFLAHRPSHVLPGGRDVGGTLDAGQPAPHPARPVVSPKPARLARPGRQKDAGTNGTRPAPR